jgi:hypothetical protein
MTLATLQQITRKARSQPLTSWGQCCVVHLLCHSAARLEQNDWREALQAATRAYRKQGTLLDGRREAAQYLRLIRRMAKERLNEIDAKKESKDGATTGRESALHLSAHKERASDHVLLQRKNDGGEGGAAHRGGRLGVAEDRNGEVRSSGCVVQEASGDTPGIQPMVDHRIVPGEPTRLNKRDTRPGDAGDATTTPIIRNPRYGTNTKGEPCRALTDDELAHVQALREAGMTVGEIATAAKVPGSVLSKLMHGVTTTTEERIAKLMAVRQRRKRGSLSKCRPQSEQRYPLLTLPPPRRFRKVNGKWIEIPSESEPSALDTGAPSQTEQRQRSNR